MAIRRLLALCLILSTSSAYASESPPAHSCYPSQMKARPREYALMLGMLPKGGDIEEPFLEEHVASFATVDETHKGGF